MHIPETTNEQQLAAEPSAPVIQVRPAKASEDA